MNVAASTSPRWRRTQGATASRRRSCARRVVRKYVPDADTALQLHLRSAAVQARDMRSGRKQDSGGGSGGEVRLGVVEEALGRRGAPREGRAIDGNDQRWAYPRGL